MREPRPRRDEQEPAHDILAAEAFAMPAPESRPRPEFVLPGDAAGSPAAHDILAAEEFAMPAPDLSPGADRVGRVVAPSRPRWAGLAGAGLLAYWVGRRRR